MHATREEIKARLGEEFPGWRFLNSDRDRWWALRGPLAPDRINETDAVDADTATELRAQLHLVEARQAITEPLSSEALTAGLADLDRRGGRTA